MLPSWQVHVLYSVDCISNNTSIYLQQFQQTLQSTLLKVVMIGSVIFQSHQSTHFNYLQGNVAIPFLKNHVHCQLKRPVEEAFMDLLQKQRNSKDGRMTSFQYSTKSTTFSRQTIPNKGCYLWSQISLQIFFLKKQKGKKTLFNQICPKQKCQRLLMITFL